MRFLSALFVLILLQGCGYKPISHHIGGSLGERVYVNITVDLHDPENSIFLKDALLQAVLARFHGKIAPSKEGADSSVYISLDSVSFSSLADNKKGFTLFYRARVSLRFSYEDKEGHTRQFNAYGKHDFSIEDSSILSDSKRFEAIKKASIQAIDTFISHVAMHGAKRVKS